MTGIRYQTVGPDDSLQRAAARHPAVDTGAVGLYAGFSRLRDRLAELEEDFLTTHGITPGRFTVLRYLTEEDAECLKPSDLASKSGVTRATITGLLDTLERDDLIRRQSDQADRRVTRVSATPNGRALIQKLMPEYLSMISTVAEKLSGPERDAFIHLCNGLEQGSRVAEKRYIHSSESPAGPQR